MEHFLVLLSPFLFLSFSSRILFYTQLGFFRIWFVRLIITHVTFNIRPLADDLILILWPEAVQASQLVPTADNIQLVPVIGKT
jgi:hypothetical protein